MGSRRRARRFLGAGALALGLGACEASPRIPKGLIESLPPSPQVMRGEHVGPAVTAGDSGTARFAHFVHARFDSERALEDVRFVDRFYRAPANEGFDAVLDRVAERLRDAGFGTKPGFELELLSSDLTARGW